MSGKGATIVGAVALVLLGVILSVSFDDAAANGASYLEALGISGVPAFLRTGLAGTIATIVLTAIVSTIATVRFTRWQRQTSSDRTDKTGPTDYDLSSAMSSLKHRMAENLKYGSFDLTSDPNVILADCNSLNLTLQKNGIPVPYLPSGSVQSVFQILIAFYTQVAPLLRDGHREQALTIADAFKRAHPHPA